MHPRRSRICCCDVIVIQNFNQCSSNNYHQLNTSSCLGFYTVLTSRLHISTDCSHHQQQHQQPHHCSCEMLVSPISDSILVYQTGVLAGEPFRPATTHMNNSQVFTRYCNLFHRTGKSCQFLAINTMAESSDQYNSKVLPKVVMSSSR